MHPKKGILIHDSMLKIADENNTPQQYINWPNDTAYIHVFHDNKNLLTIDIWFAPLFCKSQKWVAVATATCNLVGWGKNTLRVLSKKQIQHVFLLFLPP